VVLFLVFVVVIIPDSLFMQNLLHISSLNLTERARIFAFTDDFSKLSPYSVFKRKWTQRLQAKKNAHMTTARETDTSSNAKSRLKQFYLLSCS